MNEIIYLIIWIISTHFIADFGIQPEWIIKYKSEYNFILLSHCFIWAGVTFIPFVYFGFSYLWIYLTLVISHFIIDKVKCWQYKEPQDYYMVIIDQVAHFIIFWIILDILYWL